MYAGLATQHWESGYSSEDLCCNKSAKQAKINKTPHKASLEIQIIHEQ